MRSKKAVTINLEKPDAEGKRYRGSGCPHTELRGSRWAARSIPSAWESFDTVQQLVQGNPQPFPLVADVLFRNSDMAGGDELAERFTAKMLLP